MSIALAASYGVSTHLNNYLMGDPSIRGLEALGTSGFALSLAVHGLHIGRSL